MIDLIAKKLMLFIIRQLINFVNNTTNKFKKVLDTFNYKILINFITKESIKSTIQYRHNKSSLK